MESLLANYASDGDDEEQEKPTTQSFSSLPPPNPKSLSSSLLSSLPPPKSLPTSPPIQSNHDGGGDRRSIHKPSLFSSLPPPTASRSALHHDAAPDHAPPPKRIVPFTPPAITNPSSLDDDADDGDHQRKPRNDLSSSAAGSGGGGPSKSFSSLLPPPKNSLGLASTASRISTYNSEAPEPLPLPLPAVVQEPAFPENPPADYAGDWAAGPAEDAGNGPSYPTSYESYGGYENYGGYESYADYAGDSGDGSVVVDVGRIAGKRGRNEVPTEILEVKQDELMKNRPRQDQTKLTGIAFGPSYQPVSSARGKPSKLHKRKHQIGALFYDMKQKEMELAERRAKGFLTKAETQAKYGW